jgi:hypothetical protein
MPSELSLQRSRNAGQKLERLSTIQQQRDRAVVDQTHIHVRLKSTGFNVNPLPSNFGHEGFVESLSLLWPSSVDKARPATFATVAKQCELTDDQHSPMNIAQRKIHLSVVILEDSQACDLFGKGHGVGVSIVRPDAKQHQKTTLDLADNFVFNFHTG